MLNGGATQTLSTPPRRTTGSYTATNSQRTASNSYRPMSGKRTRPWSAQVTRHLSGKVTAGNPRRRPHSAVVKNTEPDTVGDDVPEDTTDTVVGYEPDMADW